MAHFRVQWNRGKVNASNWYTLEGIVIHASPCLQRFVGRPHSDVMKMALSGRGWTDRKVKKVSDACMPTTAEYLKKLKMLSDSLVSAEIRHT